jgi:hypothetical protein
MGVKIQLFEIGTYGSDFLSVGLDEKRNKKKKIKKKKKTVRDESVASIMDSASVTKQVR